MIKLHSLLTLLLLALPSCAPRLAPHSQPQEVLTIDEVENAGTLHASQRVDAPGIYAPESIIQIRDDTLTIITLVKSPGPHPNTFFKISQMYKIERTENSIRLTMLIGPSDCPLIQLTDETNVVVQFKKSENGILMVKSNGRRSTLTHANRADVERIFMSPSCSRHPHNSA